MNAAAIGLRGQKGGAVCVAVTIDAGEPHVILSAFLATAAEGDQLALEPYAVARERVLAGESSSDVMAAVAEGRRRQDQAAADGLRRVIAEFKPAKAALLVNRAGWVTDLLNYSLEWAEHVPVADGLAVREAFRAGCRTCALDAVEIDEKSLMDKASDVLGLAAAEVEARLKAMGGQAGKPWRKEQKLAALAAWITLASHPAAL